jgi:hypothetical protein
MLGYVYDLSMGLTKMLSKDLIGIQVDGIWHTSVVAFDKEYYFGEGIVTLAKGVYQQNYAPIKPVLKIEVNLPELRQETLDELIAKLSSDYQSKSYHILDHNCNHFTQELLSNLAPDFKLPDCVLQLPKRIKETKKGELFAKMLVCFTIILT